MTSYKLLALSTLVNSPLGLFSVFAGTIAPQQNSLLTAEMSVIIYLLCSIATMITIFLAVSGVE